MRRILVSCSEYNYTTLLDARVCAFLWKRYVFYCGKQLQFVSIYFLQIEVCNETYALCFKHHHTILTGASVRAFPFEELVFCFCVTQHIEFGFARTSSNGTGLN